MKTASGTLPNSRSQVLSPSHFLKSIVEPQKEDGIATVPTIACRMEDISNIRVDVQFMRDSLMQIQKAV